MCFEIFAHSTVGSSTFCFFHWAKLIRVLAIAFNVLHFTIGQVHPFGESSIIKIRQLEAIYEVSNACSV